MTIEQHKLVIKVSPERVNLLEDAIHNAFMEAGYPLNPDAFAYEGPGPGAFGFGEGVLTFVQSAWEEIAKIPDAIKILAQGLADFLNKETTDFEIIRMPDGTLLIKAKLSGPNATVNASELAAKLQTELQ